MAYSPLPTILQVYKAAAMPRCFSLMGVCTLAAALLAATCAAAATDAAGAHGAACMHP